MFYSKLRKKLGLSITLTNFTSSIFFMPEENDLLFYSFAAAAVLYVIQFIIFSRKGIEHRTASVSFAVFFAMLCFFVWKGFENLNFVYLLFPVIGIFVLLSQWRERETPIWLAIGIFISQAIPAFIATKLLLDS